MRRSGRDNSASMRSGHWPAAAHDASAGYYATGTVGTPPVPAPVLESNGHPGDAWGWAVSPGFLWNNPFGLQGDTIAAQAVWSKGAAGYATPTWGPWAVFGAGKNLGLGWMEEGVFTTGSNVELTTVWSWNAAYEHRWNPQWRTSIYGGMIGVQYDDAAKTALCANLAGTINFKTTGCSPNFSASELGTRTLWNPVPNLDVGVDLVWYHLNTAFNGGTTNVVGPFGAKPSGIFTISNQDALGAIFRIQRNFIY